MPAAKKKASSGKGKALASWDAELAKFAQSAAEKEKAPVGKKISFRGGILGIGGQPIKGNTAQVVILGAAYVNSFYEPGVKFNADNPTSPICFAINKDDTELAPHEDSTDKQNEQCEGCEQNIFGSADTGKGKACKNGRRLAMIAAQNLDVASVNEQEIFYADLPTTSAGGWALYVKGLNAHFKRPYWAMLTEMSVVPDTKTQFRVLFNSIEPITDGKVLTALKARIESLDASDDIAFPFPKPSPQVAGRKPARGRGAAPANKFAQRGGAASKKSARR